MSHPPPRIPDHVVLSRFGIGPNALLGGADRITAVLDFGPMTIGSPRHLDPLVAVDDEHLQQWCDRILRCRP